MLRRGTDAIGPVPQDRWSVRRFFDPDPDRPGKTYVREGGYLNQPLDLFDPLAFGISPREAEGLDPQQRLLLEVAVEAFDDAGVRIEMLAGSDTGVFVGGFCLDNQLQQAHPANRHLVDSHTPTSMTMTILANRLSHVFDLRGPSLTVDTACSSSLVATHLACRALWNGDTTCALVGGVNAMLRPEFPVIMSKGRFLSPHGRCKAFDADAAGYTRGEGAAIALLKPLSRARADHDFIYALIHATGANQDGHTAGISLPNSEAQEALIRAVSAEVTGDPSEFAYVEAHGTGTKAGDPLEARAIDAVYGSGSRRTHPLLVGSVKTNIGHLEAAAGIAGLIKAALVLHHGEVPPNLHFRNPNPEIPFHRYRIEIPTRPTALGGASNGARYAAVNSFGYGGANAHVALGSVPAPEPTNSAETTGPLLFPLSAHGEPALRETAGRLAFLLNQAGEHTLGDIAYSLAFRRSHRPSRTAVVADSPAALRDRLIALSTGQPTDQVAAVAPEVSWRTPVFVYTGMGPQRPEMGAELMRHPVFAETVDAVDTAFKAIAGWSVRDAMLAPPDRSRMARTEVAQPANFALQAGLTALWRHWGIEPAAIIGHSVGEVAAAWAAGALSLEDAACVSYHRSRLQQTVAGQGTMLATGISEAEAEALLAERPGVSLGAINSLHGITLSGDPRQLQEIAEELDREGRFHRLLGVEVAYHSPQMDPLRDELLEVLSGLTPQAPQYPLYSTVLGGPAGDIRWDAGYWWRNVRQPVRFAQAVGSLLDEEFAAFLEVGPHPVLGHSIREGAAASGRTLSTVPSLRRDEPELRRMLLSLGEAYAGGANPAWEQVSPASGRFVKGPAYPWQRARFWKESEESRLDRLGSPGPAYLDQPGAGGTPAWSVEINAGFFPFLHDHRVLGKTVFPGAGYVEGMIASLGTEGDSAIRILRTLRFENVLVVDEKKIQQLVTSLDPRERRATVHGRTTGERDRPRLHASARVAASDTGGEPPLFDLTPYRDAAGERLDDDEFYARLDARGLQYGPHFRQVRNIGIGIDHFIAECAPDLAFDPDEHPLHPVLLDCGFQVILAPVPGDTLFVPQAIERLVHHAIPEPGCTACGHLTLQTATALEADFFLVNPDGRLAVSVEKISCRAIDTAAEEAEQPVYGMHWEPTARPADPMETPPKLLILTDETADHALADSLVERIAGSRIEDCSGADPTIEPGFAVVSLFDTDPQRRAAPGERLRGAFRMVSLLQQVAAQPEVRDVTLVTRQAVRAAETDPPPDPVAAMQDPLALLAGNEIEGLTIRTIDLAGEDPAAGAAAIADEIAARTQGAIALRAERFEPRLRRFAKTAPDTAKGESTSLDEPVELRPGTPGKLDEIRFHTTDRRNPGPGEIEIRVERAALNYKDLLKAFGRIDPVVLQGTFFGATLGMECSGRIERVGKGVEGLAPGDPVIALLPGTLRSYVTGPATYVWKRPATLAEPSAAAAIPIVYLTAVHGLLHLARLEAGESVLIHSATGGLGQAAIAVARSAGAIIHTTAGTPEKRDWLHQQGIEHVYPSRTLEFADAIRARTDGRGIDVILSAQTGDAQRESLDLLASYGRYIEVGKKDIADDAGLPLHAFNRNLLYAAVDIDRLLAEKPDRIRLLMGEILAGFEAGAFRAPECDIRPAAEAGAAFQDLAQSRHRGKIVLDFSEGTVDAVSAPNEQGLLRQDASYLVTGGTGGFGLEVGLWLARRGAGRVVLASRRGAAAPGLTERLKSERVDGAIIEAVSCDLTDADAVESLIAGLAGDNRYPLRGVFHGAMVLEDAFLGDVTRDQFDRVLGPKALGALHLHEATRSRVLDHFILFSSVSAIVGNRGQASYIAANAFLDGLAHHRHALGLPALSINWGVFSETGVVQRSSTVGSILAEAGIRSFTNREALALLEEALQSDTPQRGLFAVDWGQLAEASPALLARRRFSGLIGRRGNEQASVRDQLRGELAALPPADRRNRVIAILAEVLSEVLRLSPDNLQPQSNLAELGVDSLILLELSLALRNRLGITFSAMELLREPRLADLAALAEERLDSTG